jgi:hypothetical protein
MTDSLFKQFSNRLPAASDAKDAETEAADDFGVFSFLRGVRDRALMLELRKKDGSATALGYGWLERVEFDPSAGLTLYFGSQKVKIVGRNLAMELRPNVRLLDGLMRHRIPWIREAGEPEVLKASPASLVIEAITVE